MASGQVIGAKCNFCEKTYKHNSANTSNLTTHVIKIHKKNHPDVVKRLQQAIDVKKSKKKLKELKVKKLLKNQPKLVNWVARKGALDPVKKDLLVKSVLEWAIATDQPFAVTESHHFRKMIFKAEPNLVLPSRTSFTTAMDSAASEARNEQKKEIIADIELTHKTFVAVTDHGTSKDRFRTHKNAVVGLWCTKDFVIKRGIIDLYKCKGSQSGAQIRRDVKNSLETWAGWKPDWRLSWVTDGESKQLNARDPNKHREVGLRVCKTGGLVLVNIFN